jgi:hypothetical protein
MVRKVKYLPSSILAAQSQEDPAHCEKPGFIPATPAEGASLAGDHRLIGRSPARPLGEQLAGRGDHERAV